MMNLPLDCFCLIRSGRAGKEVKKDHSQKQGLLGAMMARSFELELKRISVGRSIRFGGSCVVVLRKTS